MMPTPFNLVPLQPKEKEDEEDPLILWLEGLDLWERFSAETAEAHREACRLGRNPAKRYIPLEAELDLRDELRISEEAGLLLVRLLNETEGILLPSLGIHPKVWKKILRQEEHFACAKLVNLDVARAQDKKLLKATPIAFDHRVLYLFGLVPSPVAQ